MDDFDKANGKSDVKGAQTLMRALDILDEVMDGPARAADIARKLGMSKTTAHRLAHALASRDYLSLTRDGFSLGPKLLQMGALAEEQTDVVQLARPLLERMSERTGFCAFMGKREGNWSRHLDRVTGRQRLRVSTVPGDVRPLAETGLGKALLLDEGEDSLRRLYRQSKEELVDDASVETWLSKMQSAQQAQLVCHTSELGDGVRSIAAPVRNAKNSISFAISIAGSAHYLTDANIDTLMNQVKQTAHDISLLLGNQN